MSIPDTAEYSKLEVQLRANPANTGPAIGIARNGEPLPKSNFDQSNNFGEMQNFLRGIAAAYILGGLVSFVVPSGFLISWTGGSIASLIAGMLLLGITFLPDDKKRMAFLAGSVSLSSRVPRQLKLGARWLRRTSFGRNKIALTEGQVPAYVRRTSGAAT